MTAQQAAAAGFAPESIARIVAHMRFWQKRVLDKIEGLDPAYPAHAADGWPEAGEEDWPELVIEFLGDLQAARDWALKDEGLDAPYTPEQ